MLLFSSDIYLLSIKTTRLACYYYTILLHWLLFHGVRNVLSCWLWRWGINDKSLLFICDPGGIFISFKILGVNNYYLDDFQSPTITFSTVLLFLALLIFSSLYYVPSYRNGLGNRYDYLSRQLIMIIFLTITLFVGNLYQIDGLSNTATVYLVLYLMEKYSELHSRNNWNFWILIFLFSIILYKCALFLHGNPEFVIKIWQY